MNVELTHALVGGPGTPAVRRQPPAPPAGTVADTPAVEAAAPSAEVQVRKALEAIQAIKDWLPEPVRTNLDFRVEDESGHVVVTVVDSESGTVLRQIPPDVVLSVAHNLQEFTGRLVNEVA